MWKRIRKALYEIIQDVDCIRRLKSHVCQGSVAVNAARKVMSISEEHMSVQRYLQCTLWYQKHPLDRLQQADSPDIQAVCLKLEGFEAEPAKRIQDTSRCAVTKWNCRTYTFKRITAKTTSLKRRFGNSTRPNRPNGSQSQRIPADQRMFVFPYGPYTFPGSS